MRRWKIQVNLACTTKGRERTWSYCISEKCLADLGLAVEEINAYVVLPSRVRHSVGDVK